jgi:hypothetical protein
MRLPKWVVRIANEITNLALLVGVPRPACGSSDPDRYLSRMNRVHAAFVRVESTTPAVVEIVPE